MTCERRILKDLKTIHKANSPLFSVATIDDDVRTWHVNFFPCEDYDSCAIHAIFTFPASYPLLPPKANFLSELCYQHGVQTSEGELCLSILGNFADYHSDEWGSSSEAWTSSYSMHDVLLNIYTMILNPNDHSEDERAKICRAAQSTDCSTCGHTGQESTAWFPQPVAPYPQPAPDDQEGSSIEAETTSPRTSTSTAATTDSALIETCDGTLTPSELENIRFGIRCYMSQATLDEMLDDKDTTLLFGFGLSIECHSDGSLYKVTSPCEYMSYEAWESGLRTSIYNTSLDYFLPLYLSEAHFDSKQSQDVRGQLWDTLAARFKKRESVIMHKLLTSLMAHLVVTALTVRIRGQQGVGLSTRLIEGYNQIWRLTTAMCKDNWLLQSCFQARVERFVQRPEARCKKYEPSLGELYASIAFSTYSWRECCAPIIEESGLRQVRWMLQEYPELASAELSDDSWKWNVSSEATRVSRGFQAFNKYFLTNVARRASPQEVLTSTDVRYGVPSPALADAVVQACLQASELPTWREYFDWMEYDCGTDDAIVAFLNDCLAQSQNVGYHRGARGDNELLLEGRRQAPARAPRPVPRADQDENWRERPAPAPAPAAARQGRAAGGRYVPPHLRR